MLVAKSSCILFSIIYVNCTTEILALISLPSPLPSAVRQLEQCVCGMRVMCVCSWMRVNVRKRVCMCLMWEVSRVNVWLVLKYWVVLNYLINLVSRNNVFPALPQDNQNVSTGKTE